MAVCTSQLPALDIQTAIFLDLNYIRGNRSITHRINAHSASEATIKQGRAALPRKVLNLAINEKYSDFERYAGLGLEVIDTSPPA